MIVTIPQTQLKNGLDQRDIIGDRSLIAVTALTSNSFLVPQKRTNWLSRPFQLEV